MERFIGACVQFNSTPLDMERNMLQLKESLYKAKKEYNADLVVFPETVLTSFAPTLSSEELSRFAITIPGNITDEIGEICKKLKLHIVLPVYEKTGRNNEKIFNSSVLLDDLGQVVGIYRKTHPFPTETNIQAGDEIPVFVTKLAKIGMIICYDGDFPELVRIMALKGAEVVVRPSAFLRSFEIWELTNKARAFDNHLYILAANSIGIDASGNNHYGHSMIINPLAQKLAQARGLEDIIACELDPDPLKFTAQGSLKPMLYNHIEDRNYRIFDSILQNPGKSPFPTHRVK